MSEASGVTLLDPDEKASLKFTHIETRVELNQLEQVNIQEGLRWLAKQKSSEVLTEHFVRLLHKRLLGQVWRWAGTFRKTEKNIGIAPEQVAIALRELLSNVQYWIDHQVYPAKEIALRFHHALVKIHLFPNGNGRHARIITDALLEKVMGEKSVHWGDTDLKNGNKHRNEYIQSLRLADDGKYEALFEKFKLKE